MELILSLIAKTNRQTTTYKKNDRATSHRYNVDSNLIKRQPAMVEKEVFMIGNSMIKYVNGREVSRNNSVKARSHPEATANDFIDYVRPIDCKKLVIIHTG